MTVYEFLASNEKLLSFEEALSDEQIKSYNELLKLGYTEQDLVNRFRGVDLSKIDRNKKVFFVVLSEDVQNCSLAIEEDFNHPFARFLTDKKFIYKITGVEKAIPFLVGYIAKYACSWKELELWRVIEYDYIIDIPRSAKNYRDITLEVIENFYESSVPRLLVLVQN